ncbi:MAG: hypothetical protein K5893_08605 [Prevotella sp.]|nr:hypothetical protein [Prevotella sp.]
MNNRFYKYAKVLIVLLSLSISTLSAQKNDRFIPTYQNHVNATDTARQPKPGIVIAGDSAYARTFQTYLVPVENGTPYAEVVNQYRREFADSIRIYCMVIPTAVEYYCPDMARSWTHSERISINNIYSKLSESVTPVNVYSVLGEHAAEPIYARTDHHWLPLGAYYAAQEFARVADVPFRDISHYDRRVIKNFVGSMYRYSGRDQAVKNYPEEFVYYVPRDVRYETSFVEYTLDKSRRKVIGESIPDENRFFQPYPDGSSLSYCTFMGGDYRLTHVSTSTHNGRRLLILKDSFGNALPAYLFYGFEDIHVVDCRYFTKNLVNYVHDNSITDVLFANNVSHACLPATTESYKTYLVQGISQDPKP